MRSARRRGNRGVALLEAAIVLPFLALLSFGAIEAGFGYRDDNTLSRATQAAARVDARVADQRSADYETLKALDSGLSALEASTLQKVIVFDATATDGTVPDDCLSSPPSASTAVGVPNTCNVYSREQVEADDPTKFAGNCSTSEWDFYWCPTTRTRSGADPDRVGVYVELSFDKVVSVLPGSITLTETAVFQLEPCVAGDLTC